MRTFAAPPDRQKVQHVEHLSSRRLQRVATSTVGWKGRSSLRHPRLLQRQTNKNWLIQCNLGLITRIKISALIEKHGSQKTQQSGRRLRWEQRASSAVNYRRDHLNTETWRKTRLFVTVRRVAKIWKPEKQTFCYRDGLNITGYCVQSERIKRNYISHKSSTIKKTVRSTNFIHICRKMPKKNK